MLSGLSNEDRKALEELYEVRRNEHNTLSPYGRVDLRAKDIHFALVLETVLAFLQSRPGWEYKPHMDTTVSGPAYRVEIRVRKEAGKEKTP